MLRGKNIAPLPRSGLSKLAAKLQSKEWNFPDHQYIPEFAMRYVTLRTHLYVFPFWHLEDVCGNPVINMKNHRVGYKPDSALLADFLGARLISQVDSVACGHKASLFFR